MDRTPEPSKRKALLAKLARLWRRLVKLLQEPRVQQDGLKALKLALKTTGTVAEAIGFDPLKTAVTGVLELIERVELSGDVQEDLIAAAEKIKKMIEIFEQYRRSKQTERVLDFMEALTSSIDAVQASITEKLARNRPRRVWDAPDDVTDVVRMLRVIGDTADLFVMNINVNIDAQVTQVLEELKLLELVFVKTAVYRAIKSKGCTPGTRVDFNGSLLDWATAQGEDVPPVCWIYGQAGVGKTTIMYTMSSILHRNGLLGGSFFCSREVPERRSFTNIFPTIAQSLAIALPEFRSALVAAPKDEKGADAFALVQQFEILIARPARAVLANSKAPRRPRVVVIDALDECDDTDDAPREFLDIFRRKARGLGIRFLIASRPEPEFVGAFSGEATWSHTFYMQNILEDIARADVKKFLYSEWSRCCKDDPDRDWPTEDQVASLANRAAGLFIYASTAWKYVSFSRAHSPKERLKDILSQGFTPSTSSEQSIDHMYSLVLSRAWDEHMSTREQEVTLRCLQAIICLVEPLSVQDLSILLNIEVLKVRVALNSLQSVLRVPQAEEMGPVSTFHASFPDYLLDTGRSGKRAWHIDPVAVHRELYLRSWEIMRLHLRFNVSHCSSSYLRNDEQPQLAQLPAALLYACLHWTDHLAQLRPSLADMQELEAWFLAYFLFWLEALSVMKSVQEGRKLLLAMLRRARQLRNDSSYIESKIDNAGSDGPLVQADIRSLQKAETSTFESTATEIESLANEAIQFLNAFATAIEISAPHIYISALACINDRFLAKAAIRRHFSPLPSVITAQAQRMVPLLSLTGHHSPVASVAYSPDGRRLASASWDETIRIWDPTTGAQVGEPLRGHDDPVAIVSFSPNSKLIASGSWDKTIRIWDPDTGRQVGEPLRGHDDWVCSIAFSPGDRRLASGSDDNTIRIWDLDTGTQIGEPLRGHDSLVRSVAFSLDGKRLASGSKDKTVRIWNPDTWIQVGEPLCGHEGLVASVAFLPDGKRIVSGSMDRTIRIWDLDTGKQVGEPLRSPEGGVNSVAISPDGEFAASGSEDKIIRIWNLDTGKQVGEPLDGHGRSILSVAFSPDGKGLVSGSKDDSIHIWDLNLRKQVGEQLCGHNISICCVAFSPTGNQVASGSSDKTVCIWDPDTGTQVGQPMRGHGSEIASVAFSPDGKRVASGSGDTTIRIWDLDTATQVGEPLRGHDSLVYSAVFSPDGKRVASGSRDQTIRIWDPDTGIQVGESLHGHDGSVASVAISPDGKRVVSGSYDKTMRIWDPNTGTQVGEALCGHDDWVRSVVFSPDGKRLASGADDNAVRIWNPDSGTQIGKPLRGHDNWVLSVAFSPDGKRVVSGSFDRTIRIWNPDTGKQVGEPLYGHDASVNSVAFSPNGKFIVSGSDDKTIRIWDTATMIQVIKPLHGDDGLFSAGACLPTGSGTASGSSDHIIRSIEVNSNPGSNEITNNVVFSTRYPVPIDDQTDAQPNTHGSSLLSTPVALHRSTSDLRLPPTYTFGLKHRVSFTLDKDGWLRGPNKELIFWVLPEYRAGLWTPGTVRIIGAHPVRLDLGGCSLGEDWKRCYRLEDANDPGSQDKRQQ